MKISVVIPAYNCSATIAATLDSVLAQRRPAQEILVMDDGSTDETASVLRGYGSSVTVFRQANRGLATARNALIARATGDAVAFLDADDLWHPSYLSVQSQLLERYPSCVAFFTDHVDLYGYGDRVWEAALLPELNVEVIPPIEFLKRIHHFTCLFLPSFWCVPKHILEELGRLDGAPFGDGIRKAEDGHFLHRLLLLGSVAFSSLKLGAYRITSGSLSADRLAITGSNVHALELLTNHYSDLQDKRLSKAFERAFASKRREYSKVLMGNDRWRDARTQLWLSIGNCFDPLSWAKSSSLLALSLLPRALQPSWPSGQREGQGVDPKQL